MWTINVNIRALADSTNGRVKTVVHNPDFEGFYLNESPTKDKPYNLFTHLTSTDFETNARYKELRESLSSIIDETHKGLYNTQAELDAMA
jgi:hypothetical protein